MIDYIKAAIRHRHEKDLKAAQVMTIYPANWKFRQDWLWLLDLALSTTDRETMLNLEAACADELKRLLAIVDTSTEDRTDSERRDLLIPGPDCAPLLKHRRDPSILNQVLRSIIRARDLLNHFTGALVEYGGQYPASLVDLRIERDQKFQFQQECLQWVGALTPPMALL